MRKQSYLRSARDAPLDVVLGMRLGTSVQDLVSIPSLNLSFSIESSY